MRPHEQEPTGSSVSPVAKTDDELRALWRLFEDGLPYEDFPAGATWADLEDAKKLAESEGR